MKDLMVLSFTFFSAEPGSVLFVHLTSPEYTALTDRNIYPILNNTDFTL